MISPTSFDSRITVQTVTKTYDGVGATEEWEDAPQPNPLWACLVQPTKNMWMQVQVEYQQRFNKTVIWRVIVRGKQNWDYATTRFLWNSPNMGQRVLQPFENQRLEGGRRTQYTSIMAEDVTDMASKN